MKKGLLKQILLESPYYEPGSWEDTDEIGELTKDARYEVMKNDYKVIIELERKCCGKDYLFSWLFDEENDYIFIGYVYEDKESVERFYQFGYVQLKRNKIIEKLKKDYKPLYEVSEIYFDKKFRRVGLGYLTYLIMLTELKFNLMSDEIQYDGPKTIYSRFSNSSKICSDIVDIKTKEILKEDYCIYFNPKDLSDFDKFVWSSKDLNYMNRRIILYLKD